jgi:hypothetical protein
MAYDAVALATGTNQIAGTVISSFSASSVNDPLLNISAIAFDPINRLLAGLEEIGGTATGGRGKVWLFHIPDPTNKAPTVLASRTYIPNFQKTIAPMGYLRFRFGTNLYAHASNNGFWRAPWIPCLYHLQHLRRICRRAHALLKVKPLISRSWPLWM